MKYISDFGLMAGLISLGYSPVEKQKTGKRVIFLFENDEEVERLCEAYFDNDMSVDAQRFNDAMKEVKNIIHGMER